MLRGSGGEARRHHREDVCGSGNAKNRKLRPRLGNSRLCFDNLLNARASVAIQHRQMGHALNMLVFLALFSILTRLLSAQRARICVMVE